MPSRGARRIAIAMILMMMIAACSPDADPGTAAEDEPTQEPAETQAPVEPTETDAPTETTEPTETGDADGELDDVSIGIIHIVKFAFLPTHVAKELGYFEELGVNATLQPIGTGIDTLRALQAGETDLAGFAPSVGVINGRGSGSPLKIVFGPAARLSPIIIATEGIESCSDLEGQTVATDGPGGLAHAVMEAYLATCGLDIDTDVMLFIGSPADYGPALAQGTAQAAGQEVDDKAVIEAEFDIELTTLANTWEVVDFHYQSTTVLDSTLNENRDAVVRTVAALMKANRWLADENNREEAIAMAVELGDRPREVMEPAYDAYAASIFPTSCADALDPAQFDVTVELQQELGNLEAPVPYEELVAYDVCEEAEALLDS